jgi:starch synthase
MDGSIHEGSIWIHRQEGVAFYLIANLEYYDREGIYGLRGSDYPDNAFRFAFFSRAALEAAKKLDLHPDVFHINDWQTALLPVYQKLFYRGDPEIGRTAVVLSIHNLAYQGIFDRDYLGRLGLPWEIFGLEGIEFHGKMNFLKGGLVFSELLTTVSPTYAGEIQSPELGAGLDGLLRKRAVDLVGILNGIDTSIWNPSKDKALFAPYTARRPTGKAANKKRLQEKLGLVTRDWAPLFGCIARLDPQKGFDILLEAAPEMLADGAQLALLGSGREEFILAFQELKKQFPEQLSLNEGFQPELASQIYAGADLFLMPSRYEPCGLGQMIALRYGTIPVVRRTGGLADTILDLDEDRHKGNGFVFESYEAPALLDAARRAMASYRNRRTWQTLVERAMRADFSWKSSASRYLKVYERAVRKARGTEPSIDPLGAGRQPL